VVEEGEARPVALRPGTDDLGELHRHRAAEEVRQAGGQGVHRRPQISPHAHTTQAPAPPTRSTPAGTSHFQHSAISWSARKRRSHHGTQYPATKRSSAFSTIPCSPGRKGPSPPPRNSAAPTAEATRVWMYSAM